MGNSSTGCACGQAGQLPPAVENTMLQGIHFLDHLGGRTSAADKEPPTPVRDAARVWVVESEFAHDTYVELERTFVETSVGICLWPTPRFWAVQRIPPGMLHAWNEAHPAEEVREGAVLLDVNGITDDMHAMFAKLRGAAKLRLKFRRVAGMKLRIQGASELGLGLDRETLVVKHVDEEGTIGLYNRSCRPGYHIAPGDEVAGVDDETVKKAKMLQLISAKADLDMTILRGRVAATGQ